MTLSLSVHAQKEQLVIKSNSKGDYVEHKVTAKENFYSIGRAFNVHPKHLALFNSLDMSKGLSIGQTIKIPLSDTNYSHKSEFGTPVYYVTGSNETVYTVSTNNHVLMDRLRQWNQVADDKLAAGSKLIVGHLFNSQQQGMAVANQQGDVLVDKRKPDSTASAAAKSENIAKNEPKQEVIREAKEQPANAEVKDDLSKKEQPKKDDQVIQPKEEVKSLQKDIPGQSVNQGYFKASFEQQIKQQPITKEQTVTAGIFKTASGWVDSKYYLLMDGIEPGTIVKITNPTNNKIIYAKLLGEMNGLKQNQGLNVRISNAAASALDISESDKFIVKVNY
jgi:LysM repeat protein